MLRHTKYMLRRSIGVSAGAKRVGVVRAKVLGAEAFGFTKVMWAASEREVVVSL